MPSTLPPQTSAQPYDVETPYRQLFECAGIGLARLSLDGSFQEVNPTFSAICGLSRASLLTLRRHDLCHTNDLLLQENALVARTLAGQQANYQVLRTFTHSDGREIWGQMTVSLVRDDGGHPKGFIASLTDVSDWYQFEAAMSSAAAAERASQAKTDFLSSMSHELRTPLNAMLGFAQLLRFDRANPLNEAQLRKVSLIESAGAHLLAMLTDVLDLSRIEAGGLMLRIEALSVAAVFDDAVNLVSTQATERGLTLMVSPPPEHLFVRADQVRLRQIIVNLLSNAIKYNQPGGTVTIEAQDVGGGITITVGDTGSGLTPEQQAHLFEPFNRLGAERTAIEGTGIGLVIVKRLVDLMDGRLDVTSQPGVGSRFRVTLPCERHPDHPVPDDASSGVGRLGPRSSWSSFDALDSDQLHVLYAEDNIINVELVRQVLRLRPQWHLEIAHSGAEAIEMATAHPPDLLLLDMHLGDMNGCDVSDALADDPLTADIPRVGLSADAMPDQINATRQRGFVDYLTKPLNVERFLQLLDAIAKQLLRDEEAEPDSSPDQLTSSVR